MHHCYCHIFFVAALRPSYIALLKIFKGYFQNPSINPNLIKLFCFIHIVEPNTYATTNHVPMTTV